MISSEELAAKLTYLSDSLRELADYSGVQLAVYLEDSRRRRAAERMIQAIVDCSYDIALEVLNRHGLRGTGKYTDTFADLEKTGLIRRKVCGSMVSTAGLRNVLVHQYDRINDEAVYGHIKHILKDFRTFLSATQQWLKSENLVSEPEGT